MKNIILILFALTGVIGNARGQEDNYPRERIYIQTDKCDYLPGETIWYKLYITDNTGRPYNVSRIAYVQLTGSHGEVMCQTLEVANASAHGSFTLPLSLGTGYYRLTPFTRYMRNESMNALSAKTIAVVNPFSGDGYTIADAVPEEVSDYLKADINIHSDRERYGTRERGQLSIELPANVHSYALSITGPPSVAIPWAEDIRDWKGALYPGSSRDFNGEYIPENAGRIIEGVIVDPADGLPVTGGSYDAFLSLTGGNLRLYAGSTDGSRVLFHTGRFYGRHELATAIRNNDGRPSGERIEILAPFIQTDQPPHGEIRVLRPYKELFTLRSLAVQTRPLFTRGEEHGPPEIVNPAWRPDKVYNIAEYTEFNTLREAVVEYIPELRFRRSGDRLTLFVVARDRIDYRINTALVLLDGIPVFDHSFIADYDMTRIKRVDIYKDKYVIGNHLFDGIASFITYGGDYAGLGEVSSVEVVDYDGVALPSPFVRPDYAEDKGAVNEPDLAHSLLWHIGEGADDCTVCFSTSDLTGQFEIRIEGMTTDGEVFTGRKKIRVE